MKNILKVIVIVVFFCTFQYSNAQNVIMLKDRVYDTITIPNFPIPRSGELYQARIIDGYIYTIEYWDNTKYYFAKYDLTGNLIKRKELRNVVNLSQDQVRYGHILYFPTISIFKDNQNNLHLFIPENTNYANTDSSFSLYKFSEDLDSIKHLIIKTGRLCSNCYYALRDRQCIQTSDHNLLVLSSERNLVGNSDCISYKLQKLDNNLNTVWIKYFRTDSIRYCDIVGGYGLDNFLKVSSFNEIDNKYYIGLFLYDPRCIPFPDSTCASTSLIALYSFDQSGNQIAVDSFRFKKNTFGQDEITNTNFRFLCNLFKDNNGFKITSSYYMSDYVDSFRIFYLDTLSKTATKIYSKKVGYMNYDVGDLALPVYKKGLIDIQKNHQYLDVPLFYQLDPTISYLIPNQSSVKPIPDSFYMYYINRFQKVINFKPDWVDENIDTSYLLLGRMTLKDSLQFLIIIPLSNKFGDYNGRVYKDNNNNCSFDTITDTPYKNRIVEVTKTNVPVPYKYYNYTDAQGKFEIFTDTGQFRARVYPTSNLWTACPPSQSFTITQANDTVTQNFYLQRLVSCPKLSVSISTERLRPCVQGTYYINYCNRGAADASGASVQVTFDSALIVNSASVAYTHVGNVYSFQVGTIKEDSCGQFTISTTLNCSAPLGATHCVTAHIYPDSLCMPVDPRWDRANVSVDGRCLGDSVFFRIRNIGTGNMSAPKRYIVIEDNVLRITPINFQLNAGQELLIKRPANGTTQRLIADQTDYFPYPSHPTAVVENCGGFNAGFVNQFPNDDAADFIAVNCTQNVNSFDPNDKNGVPEGVNTEHLIEMNTDIDYKIRFQNTGTDTAYDVYVLDTISPKLNIASLQMGAASHTYRYEILGDGQAVLKVVFPNINLVDSFHNEALSHGFFTYRISQDTTNEEGDRIYNHADIYFDANHPVRTNTTLHTVTGVMYSIISTVMENKWQANVTAYPNPFKDRCTIEIKTEKLMDGDFHFTLFNLSGQLIEEQYVRNRVELKADKLAEDIYLYRIEYAGELIGAGKIVKN